ncbi:MAG: acyl CoA:acetate/3-ketoacid CoA transferase [Candidatus Limnocylindrales bacterium]
MRRTKVIDLDAAIARIRSGSTLAVGGSGHLLQAPDGLLAGLQHRHATAGVPADLTVVHTMGIGDNATKGIGRLARSGLVRRFIGSHYGHNPEVMELIAADGVEAYGIPGGVLSLLYREIAGGRPGLVTRVGLGTYIDPRVEGGRLNRRTTGSIAEVIELSGREWLFYPSFPIDVALLRATTSDTEGNLTMEDEAGFADNLALASAAHNTGGIVIAEVKRLAAAGSLPPQSVRVPGILVDAVVVIPEQQQTAATTYSPYLAGLLRAPAAEAPRLDAGPRKLIARRAADELRAGDVVNLGFGISTGVAAVLAEEGAYDQVVFSIEQGIVGGVPSHGLDSGTAVNAQAFIDEGAQFDLYDGGALDVCCVSFGEVDARGNVNVSKLGGRAVGPGGFINITQNSKKVLFCGTLTGGGLDVEVTDAGVRIINEGRYPKFVQEVDQITFSARETLEAGREIVYVTERAVFRMTGAGLELIEVAPGIDVERQVLERIPFAIRVSPTLRPMDLRLFRRSTMGMPYLQP